MRCQLGARFARAVSCLGVATLIALLLLSGGVAAQVTPNLSYNRDVRPILARACFACHGPDSASRKADLRLDVRDQAIASGAIVPGNPAEGELLRRIATSDPHEVMPPPEAKKPLREEEKAQLARWIAEGAVYEPHWAFIPPVRPSLPTVNDEPRVHNAIDRFVFAGLDDRGLRPAEEADRRTLVRRLSLDLTGLPPTPELVESFAREGSTLSYEDVVDQLLASPKWGEHRARFWLDAARYADTHGIHFDNYREMWSYRDWVIAQFNRNLPFDEFTIENLAGDLLPGATLEQKIGSGFNRCNMTTNEGGIIDEEYRVLYARDRTETTSLVFLGMTTGCAACHDHKFDPVTQREFYELTAFFNNTTQPVRDGNVKNTPPVLPVPLVQDRERLDQLTASIQRVRDDRNARRDAARPEFAAWTRTVTEASLGSFADEDHPYLHLPLNEGRGTTIAGRLEGAPLAVALTKTAGWQAGPTGQGLSIDGAALDLPSVGDFEGDEGFAVAGWVKLQASSRNGPLCARMDNSDGYRGWDVWTEDRKVGMHLIHAWSDDALKVVAKTPLPVNRWVHVVVSYDGSKSARGVRVFYDGTSQETDSITDRLSGSIKTAVPFRVGQRSASEPLKNAGLTDLRIYRRALLDADVAALTTLARFAPLLALEPSARATAATEADYDAWLGLLDAPSMSLSAELAARERERDAILARGTIAHVMQERSEPARAFVLHRGEYTERQDQVAPGTPAALPPFLESLPKNRLGLARWLVSRRHPLTARVTVNRFWQEVFGIGIVRTSGDFGVSGELPSHPKLLDWLAVEFEDSGWDTKALFKLMVMSATYRQSAVVTSAKLEADPENRFLSRGPRVRLDAEVVRDSALASSGLLVGTIGGPSVKPYQPEGVWESIAMNVSDTRSYQQGRGEDLYRRSLYWFWKRMAPPASMEIFDAPSREICVVVRERTNTPLQALVTLNDVQFMEAARHLAERALLAGGEDFDSRLDYLTLRILSRPFDAEERQIARGSLLELKRQFGADPKAARRLLEVGDSKADASLEPTGFAAWTMLANQLFNLDEALTK